VYGLMSLIQCASQGTQDIQYFTDKGNGSLAFSKKSLADKIKDLLAEEKDDLVDRISDVWTEEKNGLCSSIKKRGGSSRPLTNDEISFINNLRLQESTFADALVEYSKLPAFLGSYVEEKYDALIKCLTGAKPAKPEESTTPSPVLSFRNDGREGDQRIYYCDVMPWPKDMKITKAFIAVTRHEGQPDSESPLQPQPVYPIYFSDPGKGFTLAIPAEILKLKDGRDFDLQIFYTKDAKEEEFFSEPWSWSAENGGSFVMDCAKTND